MGLGQALQAWLSQGAMRRRGRRPKQLCMIALQQQQTNPPLVHLALPSAPPHPTRATHPRFLFCSEKFKTMAEEVKAQLVQAGAVAQGATLEQLSNCVMGRLNSALYHHRPHVSFLLQVRHMVNCGCCIGFGLQRKGREGREGGVGGDEEGPFCSLCSM